MGFGTGNLHGACSLCHQDERLVRMYMGADEHGPIPRGAVCPTCRDAILALLGGQLRLVE